MNSKIMSNINPVRFLTIIKNHFKLTTLQYSYDYDYDALIKTSSYIY